MAQFVGTISKLTGSVIARAEDGSTRELKLGDDVFEGETLVTGEGALVEVMMPDAPRWYCLAVARSFLMKK